MDVYILVVCVEGNKSDIRTQAGVKRLLALLARANDSTRKGALQALEKCVDKGTALIQKLSLIAAAACSRHRRISHVTGMGRGARRRGDAIGGVQAERHSPHREFIAIAE